MTRAPSVAIVVSMGLALAAPIPAQANQELPPADARLASDAVSPNAPRSVPAHYRLSGDKSVMPIGISDDGRKTTIAWSKAQALPVVFALGAHGQEEVVNGYMREDRYVIDRVFDVLVFRIDTDVARAYRTPTVENER